MRPGVRRLGAAAALVVAVVGGGGCAAAPSVPPPSLPPGAGSVQVVVVSTSLWPGPVTILAALFDASNAPVGPGDLLSATLVPLDGGPPVEAAANPLAIGSRELARVDATLPSPGTWRLDLVRHATNVTTPALAGSATLTVRDPDSSVVPGERAPAAAVPTLDDVDGEVARLSTEPHADPAWYATSPDLELAAGRPFVLVLDTTLPETVACGGALELLHVLGAVVPNVARIHAEPYVMRFDGGALVPERPGRRPNLAAWTRAWGITEATTVPWVFVVSEDGRVRAAFQGILGSDELTVALLDVGAASGW